MEDLSANSRKPANRYVATPPSRWNRTFGAPAAAYGKLTKKDYFPYQLPRRWLHTRGLRSTFGIKRRWTGGQKPTGSIENDLIQICVDKVCCYAKRAKRG